MTTPTSDRPPSATAPSGRLFWSTAAVGGLVVLYGVRGVLHDAGATHPAALARWFIGAGVLHDAVWVPVLAVGAWLTAWLPASARNPMRVGLAVTAVAAIVTWPFVQGWGRRATNPSALPLDYGRNLVLVVVVVWFAVIAVIAARVRRR